VATAVVLAASQHGLVLHKFDWVVDSVFQFFRASDTNVLQDSTHMYGA
jgi:hypothetical protein